MTVYRRSISRPLLWQTSGVVMSLVISPNSTSIWTSSSSDIWLWASCIFHDTALHTRQNHSIILNLRHCILISQNWSLPALLFGYRHMLCKCLRSFVFFIVHTCIYRLSCDRIGFTTCMPLCSGVVSGIRALVLGRFSPKKLKIEYDTIRDAILTCARKPT